MHEGHRQRLYEKLREGATLADHEILEILLFNALPRVNTNPIAHRLIDRFCTLGGVLAAPYEQLITVEGVGANAAHAIKLAKSLNDRLILNAPKANLGNYGSIYQFVRERLCNQQVEVVELYCLERDATILQQFSFTSYDAHKITLAPQVIVDIITMVRPDALVAAHNHPTSDCVPSETDDDFTRQLQIVCSMNNVNLVDHCIYSNKTDKLYSYFDSGMIDVIKRDFSATKILSEWTKKAHN